jgi:hypothetical protein
VRSGRLVDRAAHAPVHGADAGGLAVRLGAGAEEDGLHRLGGVHQPAERRRVTLRVRGQARERERVTGLEEQGALPVEPAHGPLAVHAAQHRPPTREVALRI